MAAIAQLLVVFITAAMDVLERVDKSRALALRGRLAADPCGVLVDKLGGAAGTIHAHTDKPDQV